MARGDRRGSPSRGDTELSEDIAYMGGYRAAADEEGIPDLGVTESLTEERKYFSFTR